MREFLFLRNIQSFCFRKSLNTFQIILFIIFFFTGSAVKSQQKSFPEQSSSAILIITNGAEIYSVDNALNEQIRTGKIIIQNSEISFLRDNDNKVLVKAIFKDPKNGTTALKDQIKIAENKKQKDNLKKVEKEIEKHKTRTKDFQNLPLIYFPSQNQYFSSRSIEKNYIAPAHNTDKDYKSYIANHPNGVFSSLSSFDSRELIFCNTKSLQHSFSKTFLVRPPPTFQS